MEDVLAIVKDKGYDSVVLVGRSDIDIIIESRVHEKIAYTYQGKE